MCANIAKNILRSLKESCLKSVLAFVAFKKIQATGLCDWPQEKKIGPFRLLHSAGDADGDALI